MAAARAIVTPARPAAIDAIDESATALQLTPEQLAAMRAQAPLPVDPPIACRVWASHAPAVALFAAMVTQWRAGPGGVIGLDYAVRHQVAHDLGIDLAAVRLEDLQVMEFEALDAFAELAEQASASQPTLH